ncbi:MAG: type II secretion system minor pseudopilin GspK [Candidatus Hydrogenedentes bacterium]|nr:type II secretion system minor pseudopilin GspK [Candidatus Hydrogenedentota bacterium]
MTRQARNEESGLALVIALVVVVLLSALVVEFSFRTNVEASLASNRDAEFQAYLAAKSAVAESIGLLATDLLDSTENEGAEYDSFWDATPWSAGINGKQMNEAFMRSSIDDECAKINLNALLLQPEQPVITDEEQSLEDMPPPEKNEWLIEALRAFFADRITALEVETDVDPLIDSIVDWLDYNDMDEPEPDGAESDYYEGLENPYPIKNGPMDSLEEILLIRGMSPKLYFGDDTIDPPVLPLDNYLTVHGDPQGRINANTAEREVVYAAVEGYSAGGGDANVDAAETILQRQMDQQPFMDVSELQSYFPQQQQQRRNRTVTQVNKQNRPNVDQDDEDNVPDRANGPSAGGAWRVNSEYFRIHGDGMMDDSLVRIEAFVWRRPFQQGQGQGIGPGQGQGQGQAGQFDPTSSANELTAAEPFRFLDYKIIR